MMQKIVSHFCGCGHQAYDMPFCSQCGQQIGGNTNHWNCSQHAHDERYNFGCKYCPYCGEVLFVPCGFCKIKELFFSLLCLN